MDTFKILINNRSYTEWDIIDNLQFKKTDLDIGNPLNHKLLSNDVFSFENKKVTILHSSIRQSSDLPGVLMLNGNKTYGRYNKKLLYKCIPDDVRLPSFLIPYEIKHVGFSKVFNNLYVTFQFNNWETKHPYGILNKVIGNVNLLDNFYEYQLYCKSLHSSIQKFQKATSKALEKNCHDVFIENIKIKYPSIEERYDHHIITIDPEHSTDFDDGFSIKSLDDSANKFKLTIYISNVTVWMDILNLWDSFSQRISTIYLPDKKRPMLPTILSDCLCSLQQKVNRISFYMDIIIENDEIMDICYGNALINVFKNYIYDEEKLLNDHHYNQIFQITTNLNKNQKFINQIKNSHDVVNYLMVFMNYHTAKKLINHKVGIFRSTLMGPPQDIPDSVPEDVSKFIKIWKSSSGQYINAEKTSNLEEYTHSLLKIDSYIHITSPIRRLVDLLNIIKFQQIFGLIPISENANHFYIKWINDIDYINTTMRSIRKVQCDTNLLHLCEVNPEIMDKLYQGFMFDKLKRDDGLFQFVVFLPELKLSARITTRDDINNFDEHKFKLYLFKNEEKFKKKIRLQLL
jgi:exoribonuclease R